MPAFDFVGGFERGFETVDRYKRNNRRDKERKHAIATNEERYQENKERQSRVDAEATASRAANLDISQQNLDLNRSRVDAQASRQASRDAAIDDQNKINNERNDRRDTLAEQREKFARLAEEAKVWGYRSTQHGEEFPSELHEKLLENGMGHLSFLFAAENPEAHRATMEMAPILEMLASGDPRQIAEAAADPATVDKMNIIYAEQINKGIGEIPQHHDSPIVSKRISELIPGPNGTFGVEMEITLENGIKYTAPRTQNSSTDPEDPVKLIGADIAIDDLMGRYQIASMLDGENKSKAADMYNALYGTAAQKNTDPAENYQESFQKIFIEQSKIVNEESGIPLSFDEALANTHEVLSEMGLTNPNAQAEPQNTGEPEPFVEGQHPTSTNKDTGQRWYLTNGKWELIE